MCRSEQAGSLSELRTASVASYTRGRPGRPDREGGSDPWDDSSRPTGNRTTSVLQQD